MPNVLYVSVSVEITSLMAQIVILTYSFLFITEFIVDVILKNAAKCLIQYMEYGKN